MEHDPRVSLLSPLPTLNMASHRPSRTAQPQGRQARYSTRSSRTLDPVDLSARLTSVIAEREAAEARDQSRRTQSISPGANSHLRGSRSAENRRTTHLDPEDTEGSGLSHRKSRAKSFHGPTGLEYTTLQKAQGRGFELDDRRSCPLLPDTPSLPSTVSYGHRAGAGATTRRASYIPSSRRPSDSRYVPQVAASQFASTATSTSMMDDPTERETSRRASANALRIPEPTSPRGRRRSTKASQGLWEGVHEPTIFESVATDVKPKPGDRRSMFERVGDESAQADAQPRRMTEGDVFKAGETSDDALASGGRGSADTSHYELVNDHRVDWTQADEDAKIPRSKWLLRKADSILRMRRGSSAMSRSDHESGNGSIVDGHEGDYALKSPKSEGSPKSPRSPRAFRAKSLWPFKKQATV